MAAFLDGNMRKPQSQKSYSLEELQSMTLDDGTRIITSPVTDIKRPVCAGIDVHKSLLMAAICKTDPDTLSAVFYVKQFTTTNSDIRAMADWMKSYGVLDACMESTGKYWIPVYDILEQQGIKPVLTHPKYVKQAKGHKTDFRDAIHIANLFRLDLVVASFIPPADIRDLRELCRYRLKLTYMRTAEKNRYQNSMTISKIRLDSVFSDPFGKSASSIMSYLIHTEPAQVLDEEILQLVDPRVKASSKEILESIHGYEFIGAQRDKLEVIQTHLASIDDCIRMIDAKLGYYRQKYAQPLGHLVTMVGISEASALYILGEIGADMSVWKDSGSLASWAGLAPANNASGGKKKSTKIGNGGHYLKPLLVQCALAAIKSTKKAPYFYYKYQTLKKRRGHKKAIIAIARKMLVAIYHMIQNDTDFHPIDYDDVTSQNPRAELSLKNVLSFLSVHGANEETIRLVEEQCTKEKVQAGTGIDKKTQKKKQPSSNAKPSARSKASVSVKQQAGKIATA